MDLVVLEPALIRVIQLELIEVFNLNPDLIKIQNKYSPLNQKNINKSPL